MVQINASAITYTKGGDISKILLGTAFSIDTQALGPRQVVIQALATPINPSDLNQLSGTYASKPNYTSELGTSVPVAIGGNEGLYKVIEVGKDVDTYKTGDWVIPKLPSFGTWRTHALVTLDNTENPDPFIKVSSDDDKSIDLAQAATISINPSTAYQLIDQFIKDWDPNGNDWIIQNGGNSQVGKFVVQIAKTRNIKTISVIRDGKPDQDEIVKELLDLGGTKVITDKEAESEEYISNIVPGWVSGGKVILALNCVCGKSGATLVSHLTGNHLTDYRSPHLVTYGGMLGQPLMYSSSESLFKNVTSKAYWLTANTKRNPQSKVETVKKVLDLYKSGDLKPVPFNGKEYNIKSSSDEYVKLFLEGIAESKNGKQVIIYN
ncbi:putative trans-2-enoyl-CoA reductase 1, mitochondrial [Debaryomyces fabryi]|uniref:enoyl-[acyl-carrier-protein] reductase n=1 Tax=Debaryomyces fabryi TaxID=58627 RepID=A0A0V1Q5M6_9ASCO|nr:putative trans-2-enoyl-CoA reductase 1, mitochondrial [Debaryomyces fabryi]KSA03825.1 putative trans-2-enoyl-CoA reductase 1, mitochondrial [Debaryomyces fabryi]CUM45345.1 unnamed protein product [Debaryomyces fabryi]